jgi:inosose dehydratase
MELAHQTMTWGGGVFGHPAGVTSVADLFYVSGGAPERALRDIAAGGYAGCEMFDGDLLEYESRPHEFRRLLDDTDLRLVGVYSGANFIFDEILEEEFARIERAAVFAARLGAEHLVLGGGAQRAAGLAARDLDKLAAALDEIAARAARHGLSASYHPHLGTIVEAPDMLEVLMEKTRISLCPDTAHLAAGGGDPVAIIECYADRIPYVHLKDWSADAQAFRPLGKGDLDLAAVVAVLQRAGYGGWLTVELDEYEGDPAEAANLSAAFLRTLDGLEAS